MIYERVNWLNKGETGAKPINKTNLNQMDKGIYDLQNIELIGVEKTAPTECTTGDKYFNTTDKKIYTATADNTWGETGETPLRGILYVIISSQTSYYYDGDTLISIGGGASGGTTIPVSATPPEDPEDGALWVDTNDNVLKKYNLTKTQWEVVGGAITGDTLPIGAIMPYTSKTTPSNWLPCNGQEVSRTTYADLFKIIGTQYGAGDGSTTFNVPDLNDYKVPIGYDRFEEQSNRMNLGTTGGEETHKLTVDEMPSHTHGIKERVGGSLGTINHGPHMVNDGNEVTWGDNNTPISANGGGQAHNNMQPYVTTNYIIKAFQSAGVVAQVSNTKSDSTTDTYSCDYINGINKYSTEEKVVGEWIDGKPIYRKVYTSYELLGEAPTRYLVLDTDESKEIINGYGSLKIGTFDASIPTPDAGLGYVSPLQKNSSNQIYLTTSSTRNLGDLKYVVEYTKTTD